MQDLKSEPITIRIMPDALLTQVAQAVNIMNGELVEAQVLARKMIEWIWNNNCTMGARVAVGLAAPQVGEPVRLFVMMPDPKRKKFITCINPTIERHGKEVVTEKEGCFSAPGVNFEAKRWAVIDVSYTDEKDKMLKRTLKRWEARIFQHELAHLDGYVTHTPIV